MVADWSMGLLSDSVSPMVAADSFRCGIFPTGLATAPQKGQFKIAHYFMRLSVTSRFDAALLLEARPRAVQFGAN
jgi:hypothetical protein